MEQLAKKLMSWASILEDGTREQAERTASHAVHLPAPRADAGRPPGQGRHRRLGHPDARRDHAGRGRRGHRLRHDRGPHPVHRAGRRRPAATWPPCARRSSAAIPLSAGKYNAVIYDDRHRAPHRRARGARRRRQRRARSRRTGACSSARSARATTSSRSAWTRRTASGCSCTPARAASATGWRGKHIKIAQDLCEQWWIPLPDPDLAYLVEGTDEFWAYMRDLRWAQHFALLNREEMMDRVVACLADVDRRAGRGGARRSTATTTTPSARSTSARRSGCPARARSTPAGTPGLIPGSMGTALLRRDRQGQPARAQLLAARRGPRLSAASPPARRSRRASSTRHGGHRVGRHRGVPGRDPGAYKDIDQVMADAADLVEIRHTLRQIVNVKGD